MENNTTHRDYATLLGISQDSVSYNVSLSSKTWIHRGGIAMVWFSPKNREELIKIGTYLYSNNLSFDIIGHTSNLYFTNSYNPKFIVDTKKIKEIVWNNATIICDCGVAVSSIAKECISRGIQGFEGLINLPGTIAGATVNNSGCFNCSIEKLLLRIEVLISSGDIITLQKNDLQYTHRNSAFKNKVLRGIILRVYIDSSHRQDPVILQQIAAKNTTDRHRTQEGPAQNLGSTFANYTLKKNIRNLLVRICNKITAICTTDIVKRQHIGKMLFLTLYHCKYLAPYISDKNIGCYVWKDVNADRYFEKYMHFMHTACKNCELEIEVKE